MKGSLPFPLFQCWKKNNHPQSVLQHCSGGRGDFRQKRCFHSTTKYYCYSESVSFDSSPYTRFFVIICYTSGTSVHELSGSAIKVFTFEIQWAEMIVWENVEALLLVFVW